MTNLFIPARELSKHLEGSREQFGLKLEKALVSEKEFVFKEVVDSVKVLGTFDTHLIAIVDGKRFKKVMFEKSDSGGVFFTGCENIPIPVYEGDGGIRKFIRQEANLVVGKILEGKAGTTLLDIENIMRSIDGAPDKVEKQIISTKLEAITDTKLPWRAFLEAAPDFGLSPDTEHIFDYTPKFTHLSNPDLKISEGMESLVKDDLGNLQKDLTELHSKTEGLLANITKLSETIHKEDLSDIKGSVLGLVGNLAESVVVLSEATTSIGSLPVLGELFDSLKMNLLAQTAAYKYMSKLVEDISAEVA